MSFWNEINKPIFALAPMADVTDVAFRRLIAERGKPSVMWTEFVSADGLALAPEEGRRKLLKDLEFTEGERPIVAQFFTAVPEHMRKAAKLACELGFDGVDINMGCPDRSIEKQGAGAGLMKNPKLAREIIRAAQDGAQDLPVSVKTRLGYNKDELEAWLPELLAENPAVVTIHARTRKEMSKVPARWERVKRAVEIRNEFGSEALILGNGDAVDLVDAERRVSESGADGAMLGRAIFGNPWLFQNMNSSKQIELPAHGHEGDSRSTQPPSPTTRERLEALVEHTKLFEELLGGYKNFAIMKKHFKAYVSGFSGAAELRVLLMEAGDATEVEGVVDNFLRQSLDN
jgi:nifR3 family TIM-barrel protein